MRIDIVTLFPEVYAGTLGHSIVDRAKQKNKLAIHLHQLRDYSTNKHKTVDDRPFGGGPGMVLKIEPLVAAVEDIKKQAGSRGVVLLTSPQGVPLTQPLAEQLAQESHLTLISGYYEGVDERFVEHFVDRSISIGDYVLTSGDLPAMVVVNSVARLLPGVLGNPDSASSDTFASENQNQLKSPVYTRPEVYRDLSVPPILLTGNHKQIEEWRAAQSAERSRKRKD